MSRRLLKNLSGFLVHIEFKRLSVSASLTSIGTGGGGGGGGNIFRIMNEWDKSQLTSELFVLCSGKINWRVFVFRFKYRMISEFVSPKVTEYFCLSNQNSHDY